MSFCAKAVAAESRSIRRREALATMCGLACYCALAPASAADLDVPEFRAPPHRPSTLTMLEIDPAKRTDAWPASAALDKIEDRLLELRYPTHFFRYPDGVALATPPERMQEDGSTWKEERFRPEIHLRRRWLIGPEVVYRRRARAFVFFVTGRRITQGKAPSDFKKLQLSLTSGSPAIPPGLDLPPLSRNHRIVVWVYEFDDMNGNLTYVEERLDAKVHLQMAGII